MTPYIEALRKLHEEIEHAKAIDAVTVDLGRCRMCGEEMGFRVGDRHRNTRQYCSSRCRQKAYRERIRSNEAG